MPANFNSDEISNDNIEIVEEDGDLIQRHIPTGAEFIFDSTDDAWVPAQGMDFRDSDLANAILEQAQLGSDLDANNNALTNASALEADVLNTDWIVDAGDYSTLQDALDQADSSGVPVVVAPPGEYDSVTIPEETHLTSFSTGMGFNAITRIRVDSGPAATMQNASKISNLFVRSDESDGDVGSIRAVDGNQPKIIEQCFVSRDASGKNAIYADTFGVMVTECYFENRNVTLDSNSSNCHVPEETNIELGTVTDNGTDNITPN